MIPVKASSFGRRTGWWPPIPGRQAVAQHLAHRLAGSPEATRRRALAQPFHIDTTPHIRIELHSIHPSRVPQNTLGMLGGPLERSGFPPPAGGFIPPILWVYFCSAVLMLVGGGAGKGGRHLRYPSDTPLPKHPSDAVGQARGPDRPPGRQQRATRPSFARVRRTSHAPDEETVCRLERGRCGLSVSACWRVPPPAATRCLPRPSSSKTPPPSRTLLEQHVDVNVTQPDGATALHWAAYWNDVETTNVLPSGRRHRECHKRPWRHAAVAGKLPHADATIVAKLLTAGADPNAAHLSGESPLMVAARTGRVRVVETLLAHGANVNAKETGHDQTALMWAAANRHPGVVRALLRAGAGTRTCVPECVNGRSISLREVRATG